MSIPRRLRTRVLAATAALTVGLLGVTGSATATATVPPVSQKTSKIVTADALPTAQIDGVVWSQVVVGNRVIAGGEFTAARPAGAAPGTRTTPRDNLLAYDIRTGVLDQVFAPEVNGAVKALAVSADGKTVYVGGEFTEADGKTRNHFAAFNATTGALLSMAPSVNNTVSSLTVVGNVVYLGGRFTKIGDVNRTRLAAVSGTTGALTGWAPTADSVVLALVATPDKKKIVAGGMFGNLNGSPATGTGALDAKTGTLQVWKVNSVVRNVGPDSAITTLSANSTSVFGAGYAYHGGNFEGTFSLDPDDGSIQWLEDCHGDTYSVLARDNVVYSVGHAHFCSNIGGFNDTSPRTRYKRAVAMTVDARGTVAKNTQLGINYGDFEGYPAPSLVNWFPDLEAGTYTGLSQGPWSITGNATYIALGGEFPVVNGKPQQGLVRFALPSKAPNAQGPEDTSDVTTPKPVQSAPGAVTLSWKTNYDRDDRKLSYAVLRDGAVVQTVTANGYFWHRPTVTATDTGLTPGSTYSYSIRATDPDGNRVTSPSVSITLPGASTLGRHAQPPR